MSGGMVNLTTAPEGITPQKFFGEWLPQQLEPLAGMIGSLAGDLAVAIAVRVKGEGGGDWSVVLQGGKVGIESGLKPDAVLTIVIGVENFVDFVTGKIELPMRPPAQVAAKSPEEMAAQARDNLNALKDIQGSVRFVLEDEKTPFSAMMKFGGELTEDASCTVSMGLDTAAAIAKGETNPQAAFMAGQVKIEGDMTILMQLMPLMMT